MNNEGSTYQHPTRLLCRDVVALYRANKARANKARDAAAEQMLDRSEDFDSAATIYPVTANRLTVDDGVIWEGGKRQMSTRAMLAAVLAKGEL